jgi:Flp pilus assembly protein TadG
MQLTSRNTERHRFAGLSERGQALVMTAMMLVVLFGMAGLAIDGGRAYWERRILQNAVDAGALAASDNYQDSNTISASLHAAANEYAANERIYTVAAASPSWTSTSVDITWPGAADTVHIVVAVAVVTTFDVTSSHRVNLAFMQVLGVPSPITIGAHAQSRARTGGTFGAGLITLATDLCAGGVVDSLGVTGGGSVTVTGANVQVNGSVNLSPGTLSTNGTFSDNCTNPVPPGVTATLGKFAGVAPVADPGWTSGPLANYNTAQTVGTNVVLLPGTYASNFFGVGACYFMTPGIYQLNGSFNTVNTTMFSNYLRPPDEPAWTGAAPDYNNNVGANELWGSCAGSFTVSAVASAPSLPAGWYGVVVTSTRTDYYPPQSMGGTAYARESSPSTCHAVQVGAGQGLKVAINNVPGATGYNVYAAFSAGSSPCNQLLYGYAGSIANGVVETTTTLGSVNTTFTATNIPTSPIPANVGLACNVGVYVSLCAAATGAFGAATPPGDGAETAPAPSPALAPQFPASPAQDVPSRGGGDRANENQCRPVGVVGAPCAGATVTPGAVQLYFPNGQCYYIDDNTNIRVFSGIQYRWIAIYSPPNSCLPIIADFSQVALIGAMYWPQGVLYIYGDPGAGCVFLATQLVLGNYDSTGNDAVVINYSLISVPPQGFSQISQ